MLYRKSPSIPYGTLTMYTVDTQAYAPAYVHQMRSDVLIRDLVAYRQALSLLEIRTPAGAQVLRDFLVQAIRAIEQELRSRGEEM